LFSLLKTKNVNKQLKYKISIKTVWLIKKINREKGIKKKGPIIGVLSPKVSAQLKLNVQN
jgi:hypothetical protein